MCSAHVASCRLNGQRFAQAPVQHRGNLFFSLALPEMAVILPVTVQNRDKCSAEP